MGGTTLTFYSHPDKLLKNHLIEVFEIGEKFLDKKLVDFYRIIALTHDFGKYTTFFQDHLFGKNSNKELSNHSFISALFASYVSKIKEYNKLDTLLIYSVVNNHHGNIKNITRKLYDEKDNDRNIVKKQLENMQSNYSKIFADMKELGLQNEFKNFINNFDYDEQKEFLKSSTYGIKKSKDYELYFKHQKLYSALVYSDKLSAAKIKEPKEKFTSFITLLKEYKKMVKNADKNEINGIRTDIFCEILNSIDNLEENEKILTITSPTGSGKTYAGFYAAQKIKEKYNKKKIIYALPFTSIIDQNYETIKKLLENEKDFAKNKNNYLIKHHYLSTVEYKSDDERYKNSQAELLIEGWNSGIIVTTFVQLIESIITNKNRYLKKLNQLKNSVILLDEIQAIDVRYYEIVEAILTEISQKYDSHIIIMTATKPIIFSKSKELLPNNEKYFKHFNRVSLEIDLNEKTIDKICQEINIYKNKNSLLVVANTINESLEIYNRIKDENTYYLSTNLLPIHRKERINEIKEKLKKGKKLTLISTQILEAGVDIDFEIVIRDIAQLDSIVQAAGRCNRNSAHKTKGKVLIRKIINENGKVFASFVYSSTSLQITDLLLKKYCIIEEKDFKELIEEYYKLIKDNISCDDSYNYINSVKKLNFEDEEYGLNTFSLIKDNAGYIDIFLIVNDEARKIYDDYSKISQIKDFQEKREKYLKIKPLLNNYTLSIPIKYTEILKSAVDKNFIPCLNEIECQEYYDKEIGVKRPEKEDYLIL